MDNLIELQHGEEVSIYDPGEIGAVMITSESEKLSAIEMVNNFKVTLLDEYLDNSGKYRLKPGNME